MTEAMQETQQIRPVPLAKHNNGLRSKYALCCNIQGYNNITYALSIPNHFRLREQWNMRYTMVKK